VSKILIFGVNGMLGHAIFKYLNSLKKLRVFGTLKSKSTNKFMSKFNKYNLLKGVDVENKENLLKIFKQTKPDVVINCVGLTKHSPQAKDFSKMIYANSFFPHHLVNLSSRYNARLIHISTDCIFSGKKGNYVENDFPDALDLYGKSKLLGEINYPNTITLRTSLIGHEVNKTQNLLEWFLSQSGTIKGYRKAIFSGLTTFEISKVISDYILPNSKLQGLYHLSSKAINKYDLLNLIKNVYEKSINIIPDDALIIDRSLNSSNFRKATGYSVKPWNLMIKEMRDFG
jgi:dTDP-4-dehydrorhamnose reductase